MRYRAVVRRWAKHPNRSCVYTVSMDSVCGGAESDKRMIITCPHCHAALDIADKQIGERVHHARCNNWSMVGQHADGTLYGVKVQPPITMPARQRTQR